MEEPPWGLEEFGFTDITLLQLLEALGGGCSAAAAAGKS